jgi:hypothetical protein
MPQRSLTSQTKACQVFKELATGDLATFEQLQPWVCDTFSWVGENSSSPNLIANVTLQSGRYSSLVGALAAASGRGLQLLLGNACDGAQQQQQQHQQHQQQLPASHGSSISSSRDSSSTSCCLISVLQSHEAAVKCTSACIRAYAQLLHCHVRDNTGAAQRRAQQEAAAAAASAGKQPR